MHAVLSWGCALAFCFCCILPRDAAPVRARCDMHTSLIAPVVCASIQLPLACCCGGMMPWQQCVNVADRFLPPPVCRKPTGMVVCVLGLHPRLVYCFFLCGCVTFLLTLGDLRPSSHPRPCGLPRHIRSGDVLWLRGVRARSMQRGRMCTLYDFTPAAAQSTALYGCTSAALPGMSIVHSCLWRLTVLPLQHTVLIPPTPCQNPCAPLAA